MKKNDFLVFAIFDLIYLFAACLAASLVGFVVVWGVNLFYDTGYATDAGIRAAVVGLVSVGLCAILAYRDGYRYANFSWAESLLSAGIASAIHFVLGLTTRFAPIAFGPTRNLAGLGSFGGLFTAERVEKISFGVLIAVGAVMMLVYAVAFVLANRFGCQKRLRDRAETVDGQSASK